jgi:hypothetical protein
MAQRGRPSKIPPSVWEEIGRRLAAGESANSLSKEFKVSNAAISARFAKTGITENVKEVAADLAKAQSALLKLPAPQQYAALSIAENLRGATDNFAAGIKTASNNFRRLQALAESQMQQVDEIEPFTANEGKSGETLKGVVILTKAANECAASGQILMNSGNKDMLRGALQPAPEDAEPSDNAMDEAAKRIAYILHHAANKEAA